MEPYTPKNNKSKKQQGHFDTLQSDVIVESPGRINLIGEHIDYNGGFVLPAAIDKKITIHFKKNGKKHQCSIVSLSKDRSFTIDLRHIGKSDVEWENYILGTLHHINLLRPKGISGFDCVIESDLPIGAGISSSAALECGLAKGLNELFDLGLTDIQLITLSRDAEHDFVGTKCGIMDQFAVMKGEKDKLILLNCKTLDFRLLNVNLDPYKIVLLNSNVTHSLSETQYNARREESEMALRIINDNTDGNGYIHLADVPEHLIENLKTVFPPHIYYRALYVVQEKQRVISATIALGKNNITGFGKLLYQSHHGLQKLYEVSCRELDFLVDHSKKHEHVIGSRIMGGGFGGCTINLIHKDHVEDYIKNVSKAYYANFSIALTPIMVSIGNGVSIKD